MNKFYLIRMDALGSSFSDIKAGNKIKFKVETQDSNNLFAPISVNDIVVGIDELCSPQISTILKVTEKKTGQSIILQKIIEAYPGCKITNATILKGVKDKTIVEIKENLFKEIYEALVPKLVNSTDEQEEEDDKPREKFGVNRLFYGVPGVGKSYTVKKETEGVTAERVVFHPDYTYADFIGQILPKHNEEEDRLEYKFTPGPFTKILKTAQDNPGMKCCLIIEELNRGNAPAIFGELFQLLDRSEEADNFGESIYGVTNQDIAKEVYGDADHKVKIPSNLSIFATMNTSDQNVFTLDTAFQRRWFMTYIPNKFDKAHAADMVKDTSINWGAFATTVNECLHNDDSFMSTEDKSLGVFFATAVDTNSMERFAEKVLKYLWDDAFKLDRTPLFKETIKSFGQLIMHYYDAEGDRLEAVIKPDVYAAMKAKCAKFADTDQQ